MDNKREYKPDYDEAFRDEQLKWFEQRMDQLPQSLQISESSSTSNLKRTVQSLMLTLQQNKPSVTFSGYMETLMKIKDKLQEQGIQ